MRLSRVCTSRGLLLKTLPVALAVLFMIMPDSVSAQRPRPMREPQKVERRGPDPYRQYMPRQGERHEYPRWFTIAVGLMIAAGAVVIVSAYVMRAIVDPDARDEFYGHISIGSIILVLIAVFSYLPAWVGWCICGVLVGGFYWFVAIYAPRAAQQLTDPAAEPPRERNAE